MILMQVKQRPDGHLMYKLSARFFVFSTTLVQDSQSSVLQIKNWLTHPLLGQGFIFGHVTHQQQSNNSLRNLSYLTLVFLSYFWSKYLLQKIAQQLV